MSDSQRSKTEPLIVDRLLLQHLTAFAKSQKPKYSENLPSDVLARQQAQWAGTLRLLQEIYRIYHETNQRTDKLPDLAFEL